jgi:glycosyltransferase involved in cell wall biosynthesis
MIPNNLISAASFTPNSLQSPNAWIGHLPFAAWVIQEVSPKIFVELGTHTGNSYFSFCQSVVETGTSTKCYAVDTWQGDEHAGQYNDEIFITVNSHHQEHYVGFSRLLRMTFDDAVSYFADESIELLHIDGLHTYEAVRHDFETWLPKLAPGAVVMFHDTNVRVRNFGVWKLWEELQARYPNNLEFVHSHGLGVLQLNNAPDKKKLEWLQPNSPEKQRLLNYFAALGSWQLGRYELNELNTQIAKLSQALTERDGQIVTFSQGLAERDGQIAGLAQAVHDKDVHIGNITQMVAEHSGQIVSLNQVAVRYTEALSTIEEIRGSSSWRVTAPIRYASSKVRNFGNLFKLLPSIIRFGGGVVGSTKKAWRIFSREGWAGVKRRILFVGGNRSGLLSSKIRPDITSAAVDRNDYAEWVRRYDTLTANTRATMRLRINTFDNKPLITVVMPTYNPKPEWLIEAIESVRKQIYPNWELCIADDASTDKSIRPILESYAREDSRIKVVFREKNGHISAASNSALDLAIGEWVALLDHDDLLTEHALFWMADAINQNPDVRLIYSDEDKIDDADRRLDPYFKCDWNVDLFYSHNLITHLGLYRADLLNAIGGFRVGLEGAQDYDLALRCIEHIETKQIHHIPRVLYHWRMHDQSTAQSANSKPYAMLAGERALNEHFQRQKINAQAEHIDYGYRVRYALPDSPPMVSLVIPTRNGLQLIRQCVESILKKTTYPNYEILIIDNGSDDPATIQYLNELQAEARVRVVRDDRPFNYSALNNAAVKLTRGEVVGLLNNDLEVISPDWLSEMVSIALQPGVGAVGARLWYPNSTLQHGGVILGIGGWAGHSHKGFQKGHPGYVGRASLISGFTAITGACLIVRKGLYEEAGGLNEADLQIACNDVDFCLRLREKGYRNVWTPYAELYHHESATRGYEDTPEKQARFAKEVQYMKQRWGDLLLHDPAYSPNLTLDQEDFSLAWPPRINSILH